MKILALVSSESNSPRGPDRFAIETYKELARSPDIEIFLVCCPWQKYFEKLKAANVHILCPPNVRFALLRQILDVVYMLWYNIKIKPDLIHFTNTHFVPPLFNSSKTVLHILDLAEFEIEKKYSKLQSLFRRVNVLLSLYFYKNIVTISEFTKTRIVELCKKYNIRTPNIDVVYLGYFELDAGDSCGDYKTPFFLYVGAVENTKIHDNYFIAFKEILKRFPNVLFYIAGKPDNYSDQLNFEIRKLGIEKSVILLGFVPDHELICLYKRAASLVCLSYYEGFGLQLVEAMANRCPVITSNRTSLPEIAGNAGLIVDPDSIEEIKNAYLEMLNTDKRDKYIKLSVERAKLFTWKVSGQILLTLFRKLTK